MRWGLSACTVPAPTSTASCSARHLCTSRSEGLEVRYLGARSPPMNPSMLWAIFTWTYGIARAICFRKNLFNCLASASRRPHDTRIPAPRSARIPLPATSGLGSFIAITTDPIPEAMILSVHGGVLP